MNIFEVVTHNDEVNQARLAELDHPSTWTAMRCANEAGVSLRTVFAYDPNRSTSVPSAGADYLTGVVGSILERIESEPDEDRSDQVCATADGCIPIPTLKQWDTFHDLYAWTEDLSELGGPTNDMTSNATMALYMIGSRLAQAVIDATE